MQPCPGTQDTKEARGYALLGHRMRAIQANPPFLFCVRCGGSSLRRAYKLGRRCEEPNASGRQALKRVAKGLHPWRAKDKRTGKEVRRGEIGGERAFDAETGGWIESEAGIDTIHSTGRRLRHNACGVAIKHKGKSEGARNGQGQREVNGSMSVVGEQEAGDGGAMVCNDLQGQEEEGIDVFGHGGSLDQDGETDQPGVAPAIVDQAAWRGNEALGSKCTIIEHATKDEPVRKRASVWVDGEHNRVDYRGEDGRPRTMGAIGGLGKARREGSYAVVVGEADVRFVFTCAEDADDFWYRWSQATAEEGGRRPCDPGTSEVDGGAVAEARQRAARAKERIENLRRRVIMRASGTVGDGEVVAGARDPEVLGTMEPAPVTPVVHVNGAEGDTDPTRTISTGCGCGGRLHEGCARRVRPRLQFGHGATTEVAEEAEAADAQNGASDGACDGDDRAPIEVEGRHRVTQCGMLLARGEPASEGEADQGLSDLRVDITSRVLHPLHVYHHRGGAEGDE